MATILVIEDDERILKALHRLFVAEGYEIRSASDGKQGLEMFASVAPEAVILDLMLPGMSGREICRSLKQSYPDTPVVILSAISEVADKVLLLELGADDYVTKPFSPRELLARTRTAHEFKLLRFFLDNPERVLSREELLNEVWGYNSYPSTRTVDNQILKLRQKLEANPADPVHFCTVHGAGYRFVPMPAA